jgi:hypothetical protein
MIGKFFRAFLLGGGGKLITFPIAAAPFLAAYSVWRAKQPSISVFWDTVLWPPVLEPWWLWSAGVILLWMTVGFAIREAQREAASPRLFFDAPFVELVWVNTGPIGGAPTERNNTFVASVILRNNPQIRQEGARLSQAHVTLKFFDWETGKLVHAMPFARWADNVQPGQPDAPSSIDPARYRTIKANNGANKINIALKYPSDSNCYAFNADGWMHPFLKDETRKLDGTKFYVHVIVSSENAPDFAACFELGNLPEGLSIHATNGRFSAPN